MTNMTKEEWAKMFPNLANQPTPTSSLYGNVGQVINPGTPPVLPKTQPYIPPDLGTLPEYESPDWPDMPTYTAPDWPDMPTYTAPDWPDMPTYTAPDWDEEKIKGLTQTFAAPGLRSLRQQIQKATAQPTSNPNVKAMTLREALAGYGAGLESVMSGARQTAGSEYAREYGIKSDEAKINFNTELNKTVMQGNLTQEESRTNFQAALNKVVAEGQMSLEEVKVNFQAALNKAVEQGRVTQEEARINYQSMLNQALAKQQIGQETSKINYEAGQKKLYTDYQAAYNDYMAKEARKPVYGGVSPSYAEPKQTTTPSRTMRSDYGEPGSGATPSNIDLMSYIGGGGYEPSTFIEREKPDYGDNYKPDAFDWEKAFEDYPELSKDFEDEEWRRKLLGEDLLGEDYEPDTFDWERSLQNYSF